MIYEEKVITDYEKDRLSDETTLLYLIMNTIYIYNSENIAISLNYDRLNRSVWDVIDARAV